MIPVTRTITLGDDEVQLTFIRASGPGGQNVNKVSSAVQLRFDVANSPNLPEAVRARLVKLAGQRLTQHGVLVLTAQTHRSQERNRAEALERLLELIRAAARAPVPRRATKPTRGSKERRLEGKAKRSVVKTLRQGKPGMD